MWALVLPSALRLGPRKNLFAACPPPNISAQLGVCLPSLSLYPSSQAVPGHSKALRPSFTVGLARPFLSLAPVCPSVEGGCRLHSRCCLSTVHTPTPIFEGPGSGRAWVGCAHYLWASLPKDGPSQSAVWECVCHCHGMTLMSLPGAPACLGVRTGKGRSPSHPFGACR